MTLWSSTTKSPYYRFTSKQLINGKAPHHEDDTFIHINNLLYKYAIDATQKFLVLVIPKSWNFTVLVEAHDKLGHMEVNRAYHLIKWQYYWKGMNKDISEYIANCTFLKEKMQKCKYTHCRWWIYLIYPLWKSHRSCHRPQCLFIR